MTKRKLPSNASVATKAEGDKLVAPAASRNAAALSELLAGIAPTSGRALELASGTGQHIAAFAKRLPGILWQPSEIVPERRASIDAYSTGSPNIAPALHLDATTEAWHMSIQRQDLVVLINLLHLISWPETRTLVTEAARALRPGGQLVLYGPFMRSGQLTSDGDQKFHAALTQQDPEIGYKNDTEMLALLQEVGFARVEVTEMPANNLALIAREPAI
ncbi:generic methyltransferase [Rhodobacteraceae bacterium KLH11]|nr:generic methyltransferase [Rhodobacteraceae bacterium KLH11]